jgi:Flp pilus assembly protein CpaB
MAGKALTRRSITLIIALVLAALAALALSSYVQSAHRKALAGLHPLQVYVAKSTISSGTSGSAATTQGLIIKESIPKQYVAQGAIGSLSQIQDEVAQADITAGEQILAGQFVSPQSLHLGLLPIPTGDQAISVQVNIPPGVAGFLQPGDTVSVLALNTPSGQGAAATAEVKYLLQDVQLLAVGQHVSQTVTSSGGGLGSSSTTSTNVLLTLAVTPSQAEQLTYAVLQGQIYFTLVPQGQAPATTPGRTGASLFQ